MMTRTCLQKSLVTILTVCRQVRRGQTQDIDELYRLLRTSGRLHEAIEDLNLELINAIAVHKESPRPCQDDHEQQGTQEQPSNGSRLPSEEPSR